MRATSRLLVAALACAAVALAACSGDETAGAPTSKSTPRPGPTTSAAAPSATSAAAVARPAVLPLAGIGPCDLVTAAARTTFGIDGEVTASEARPGTTLCVARSSAVGRFVVVTVIGQGMADLLPGGAATVGGFPAAELREGAFPNMCHLSVDVADAQRLDVEIQPTDTALTQDKVCQDTAAFAETVLAELRQRLGR